ncbi:hypothetical protein [Streptomyces sp. NPDC090025]|uniref:hypothetical protein n=1 Tax=Streptomyces sp. NPDC090025 TaxID=3365922 RepID=UPI0038337E93
MNGIRGWLRTRRAGGPRGRTERTIARAEADLRSLGLDPRLPGRVRAGVRIGKAAATRAAAVSSLSVAFCVLFALAWWQAQLQRTPGFGVEFEPRARDYWIHSADRVARIWSDTHRDVLDVLELSMVEIAFVATFVALGALPALYALGALAGSAVPRWRVFHYAQRQLPLLNILAAVHACAVAHRATLLRRPHRLKAVSSRISGVVFVLQRLHRGRSGLLIGRRRRAPLKHHTALVVAALRRAEARLDTEGPAALPDLAALLLTIADRYAAGRHGALLDDAELAGLTPVRDWEPVRMAVSAVLIAASALTVTWLDLPEGADTYVIGGSALLVLVLVYGRRVRQALGVLAAVRGA